MKLFLLSLLLFVTVYCGADYYDVLSVSRDATKEEIKAAYRKLTIKEHPDKGGDPQKFSEIVTAYETLIDDSKRRKYDLYGEEGLKETHHMRNPFGFEEFDERERHLPHLSLPIEVTLEDLYMGRSIRAHHRKHVICPKCRGSGARKPSDIKKCSGCGGSGMKVKTMSIGGFGVTRIQQTCDECGGKGTMISHKCPHCNGSKVDIDEEPIMIYIEKGMNDGDEIVFREQGDQRPDINSGDLRLVIQTQKHRRFVRDGNNLRTRVHVTLLEALIGFTKNIKHLDGHLVTVERSTVTEPGFILPVRGAGMPIKENASEFGDLFVEFVVDFPLKLSEKQKNGFKELLK